MLDSLFGSHCRACGRRARLQRLGELAPTHPGAFHTRTFGLIHCERCDVVYLDPLPTANDLRVLYEESEQFSDPHYTDPDQVSRILDYYGEAVRALGLLDTPGARVLEVGAGLAWVSRACKMVDPRVLTVAQDVSSECANACAWVDTYNVGTLAAIGDHEPFQLASMTHVIEHLADPAAMLGEIAARLAPGGKLFITAPFRPAGWQPAHGIKGWSEYSYLHVPAHITYFSRRWFEREAPRHAFNIIHWNATHEDGQAFELVLRKN